MADLGWARSQGDRAEKEGLRRGAWYRVIEDSGVAWVVLDVNRVEVRVPRQSIDLRREAPRAWSVVHEPHLVCPGCHHRQHVSGQPAQVECPECSRSYAVEWSDRA